MEALRAAGVKLAADGAIVVDAYSRSSVASIHAIGDVTNRINLTPVATSEGMALAKTLFRAQPTLMDYDNIPTAIFAIHLTRLGEPAGWLVGELEPEIADHPWRLVQGVDVGGVGVGAVLECGVVLVLGVG